VTDYTIDGDTVPREDSSHFTPNVIVENPKVRKVINYVLHVGGALTAAVAAADTSSDAFDATAWTIPVGAVILTLSSLLGLGVTIPNIPKR